MQDQDSLDEAISYATTLQFPISDEEEIDWSNLKSPGVIYPDTDRGRVVYLIRPFNLWPDVVLHREATRMINDGDCIDALLGVYGEDRINGLLKQPPQDTPIDLNPLIDFCKSWKLDYTAGQHYKKGGNWEYVIVHQNGPKFFEHIYPLLNRVFNQCLAPLSKTQ